MHQWVKNLSICFLIMFYFMSIMIREGSIDDFRIIKKIERSSFNKFAYSDDEIEYMLKTSRTLIFEEKEPKAYLSFYVEQDECHLESIAVVPKYKRSGLGTILMSKMEDICKMEGKKRIVLEVRERNRRAINFYKKLGFKEFRLLENYYILSYRGSRNAIFMVKELCSGPVPAQ